MIKRISKKHPDLMVCIGLATLAIVVLMSVRTTLFYKADYSGYVTLERAVRGAFTDGVLPLWNTLYSEPLVGNPQAATFYLPLMLLRFVPLYPAMEISIIAHTAVAGIGAYLFLRDCDLKRSSAIFGSIAFMLSGTTIFRIAAGHIALVHAIPWIAWSLFAYGRFLEKFEWKHIVLTSIFIVLLALTGHPQWSLICVILPGAYFLFFLISNWGNWEYIRKGLGGSLLIALLCIGLLAIQLLPTIEYISNTVRGDGISFQKASSFALELIGIMTLQTPFIAGEINPDTGRLAHEYASYTGVLTVGLATASLKNPDSNKRQLAIFFFACGAFALVLALGSVMPFYRIFYEISGGFFRVPGRFMVIFTTSISFMAALGFDMIQQYVENHVYTWNRLQIFFGLIVCLMLLITFVVFTEEPSLILNLSSLLYSIPMIILSGIVLLVGSRRFNVDYWQWIMVSVLTLDLFAFTLYAANWQKHSWPNFYSVRYALNDMEIEQTDIRVFTESRELSAQGVPVMFTHEGTLSHLDELITALGNRSPLTFASQFYISPLMDVPSSAELFGDFEQTDIAVYQDPQNLPRVYAAPAVMVFSSEENALDFITSSEFDPFATAVTFEPTTELPQATQEMQVEFSFEWLTYNAQTVEVRAVANQPVMVVFAEPYYSSWRATVDGEQSQLWRVNYAFRGVIIPEGTHTIKLTMHSTAMTVGAVITSFTVIVILAVTLVTKKGYRYLSSR